MVKFLQIDRKHSKKSIDYWNKIKQFGSLEYNNNSKTKSRIPTLKKDYQFFFSNLEKAELFDY